MALGHLGFAVPCSHAQDLTPRALEPEFLRPATGRTVSCPASYSSGAEHTQRRAEGSADLDVAELCAAEHQIVLVFDGLQFIALVVS